MSARSYMYTINDIIQQLQIEKESVGLFWSWCRVSLDML